MTRSRLFILDGTSGVWKQELMAYTAHRLASAATIEKLTTRAPREGEDFRAIDLQQVSTEAFELAGPDYRYEYGGQWYGFTKASISAALRDKENVFVIVRNAGVIRRLRKDFAKFCPTTAFVYVDSALAARRAQEMSSRLVKSSIEDAYMDYMREPELYDEVLIHADATNDLYRLVNVLCDRGTEKDSFLVGGRLPIVVVTSGRAKALILLLNSLVLTASLGIAINILTAGESVGWRLLSLVLAGLVALLAVTVSAVFVVSWRKRTN